MAKKTGKRKTLALLGLGAALLAGIVLSAGLGRYSVGVREIFGILAGQLFPIEPFWSETAEKVVLAIRLPRICAACLVGASLAGAGCCYQSVFRNPLASPNVLGATSGAGFGAALAILLGFGSVGVTGLAFAGGLSAVALVFGASRLSKRGGAATLLLAGVLVSSLFSSGTSFLKLVADQANELPAITYWLMGSLSGAGWRELRFALLPAALGLLPLFLLRWRINLLALGDGEAAALGADVRKLRALSLLCAALATAAAVSVGGVIGWVGLVVPHFARKLVGGDGRALYPASLLLGALFLLLVDDLSRTLLAVEIPIGILCSFAGIPFFLYLLCGKGAEE